MDGGNPLSNFSDIYLGIPFSLTLMLILGCHEFGHYYYALKHNVDATLPYFLPAPPYFFIIGTFGAFIKIKSPIYRKDALLQIGAAGPIAGFIIAVPSLIIGLLLSEVIFINDGSTDLKYLALSTKKPYDICEYPDSDKILSRVSSEEDSKLWNMSKGNESYEYFEGEE